MKKKNAKKRFMSNYIDRVVNPDKEPNQLLIDKLFLLFSEGDFSAIKAFIFENNMIMNHVDENNNSIIHKILSNGDLNDNKKYDLIKFCVENNCDVSISNLENITPLHLACKMQAKNIVELLLQYFPKFKINSKDWNGNSALHYVSSGIIKDINIDNNTDSIGDKSLDTGNNMKKYIPLLNSYVNKFLVGEYKYFFEHIKLNLIQYKTIFPDKFILLKETMEKNVFEVFNTATVIGEDKSKILLEKIISERNSFSKEYSTHLLENKNKKIKINFNKFNSQEENILEDLDLKKKVSDIKLETNSNMKSNILGIRDILKKIAEHREKCETYVKKFIDIIGIQDINFGHRKIIEEINDILKEIEDDHKHGRDTLKIKNNFKRTSDIIGKNFSLENDLFFLSIDVLSHKMLDFSKDMYLVLNEIINKIFLLPAYKFDINTSINFRLLRRKVEKINSINFLEIILSQLLKNNSTNSNLHTIAKLIQNLIIYDEETQFLIIKNIFLDNDNFPVKMFYDTSDQTKIPPLILSFISTIKGNTKNGIKNVDNMHDYNSTILKSLDDHITNINADKKLNKEQKNEKINKYKIANDYELILFMTKISPLLKTICIINNLTTSIQSITTAVQPSATYEIELIIPKISIHKKTIINEGVDIQNIISHSQVVVNPDIYSIQNDDHRKIINNDLYIYKYYLYQLELACSKFEKDIDIMNTNKIEAHEYLKYISTLKNSIVNISINVLLIDHIKKNIVEIMKKLDLDSNANFSREISENNKHPTIEDFHKNINLKLIEFINNIIKNYENNYSLIYIDTISKDKNKYINDTIISKIKNITFPELITDFSTFIDTNNIKYSYKQANGATFEPILIDKLIEKYCYALNDDFYKITTVTNKIAKNNLKQGYIIDNSLQLLLPSLQIGENENINDITTDYNLNSFLCPILFTSSLASDYIEIIKYNIVKDIVECFNLNNISLGKNKFEKIFGNSNKIYLVLSKIEKNINFSLGINKNKYISYFVGKYVEQIFNKYINDLVRSVINKEILIIFNKLNIPHFYTELYNNFTLQDANTSDEININIKSIYDNLFGKITNMSSVNILKNNIEIEDDKENDNISNNGVLYSDNSKKKNIVFVNTDIVELLIGAGADINIKNNDGRSVIFTAIDTKNTKLLNTLIKYKISTSQEDNLGMTPKQFALQKLKTDNIFEIIDKYFSDNFYEYKKKYNSIPIYANIVLKVAINMLNHHFYYLANKYKHNLDFELLKYIKKKLNIFTNNSVLPIFNIEFDIKTIGGHTYLMSYNKKQTKNKSLLKSEINELKNQIKNLRKEYKTAKIDNIRANEIKKLANELIEDINQKKIEYENAEDIIDTNTDFIDYNFEERQKLISSLAENFNTKTKNIPEIYDKSIQKIINPIFDKYDASEIMFDYAIYPNIWEKYFENKNFDLLNLLNLLMKK